MSVANALAGYLCSTGLVWLVGFVVPFTLAPCVAYLCRRAGWTR